MKKDLIKKEAEQYKNKSSFKIKLALINYKLLSYSNGKNFNFFSTLIFMFIPYLIFFNINLISFLLLISLHYFYFHKFLYVKKNKKMVSDEEKEEIDEIIPILESYLKDRKTKNPS